MFIGQNLDKKEADHMGDSPYIPCRHIQQRQRTTVAISPTSTYLLITTGNAHAIRQRLHTRCNAHEKIHSREPTTLLQRTNTIHKN